MYKRQHLDSLEERLVTRFKWGLTQNITPPDFETRIAILRNKIEDLDYIFPNDTLEYLAGQFDSNVRDLEGALNDISLMAKVKKLKEITIDVAAEAIRARKNDNSKTLVIPIEKIQEAVGALSLIHIPSRFHRGTHCIFRWNYSLFPL